MKQSDKEDQKFIECWKRLGSPTLVGKELGMNPRSALNRRASLEIRYNIKLETDLQQAFVWFHKAADVGFAPAQAALGMLYARMKDFEKAALWWRLAADRGDPEAQYNLGNAFSKGRGMAQDPALAFYWFSKAAEHGIVPAQSRLGLMYVTGDGVTADAVEAHKWFVIASAGGDKAAQANLVRSEARQPQAALAEAKRRAEEWLRAR